MFYVLTWSVVLVLCALWSLIAWAFHAATAWAVSNTGVLAGGSAAIEALRVPDWLAPWIAPELAAAFKPMLSAIAPTIQAVLNQVPAHANGLSVTSWAIWGIGSAFLIVLGMVVSRLITVARHRRPSPTASARAPAAAG